MVNNVEVVGGGGGVRVVGRTVMAFLINFRDHAKKETREKGLFKRLSQISETWHYCYSIENLSKPFEFCKLFFRDSTVEDGI